MEEKNAKPTQDNEVERLMNVNVTEDLLNPNNRMEVSKNNKVATY